MKRKSMLLLALVLIVTAMPLAGFAETQRDKLVITATIEGNADAHDSMVEEAFQELMSEKLNREIEIQYTMIPSSDYATKTQLLLAVGDLTDFFQLPFLYDYTKPMEEGYFLELSQYRDQLDNYFNYIEQTSGGLASVMTAEGEVYIIAGIGLPRFPADRGMLPNNLTMYRADIFDKHGIPYPTTIDEMYEAAKQLKELYPDVYPINTRWNDLRSLFAANHTRNTVYWNGEEYVQGLFEEGYKEAIAFAQKLYVEGLLDPEYIIETDDTLKSKEMTDRTFIVMADWFTTPGEFTRLSETGQIFAAALMPDNPKYGTCWQSVDRVNEISRNGFYSAVIRSDVEDVEGLLEFLNTCYEEDVVELLNWGIEGVTYTVDADGNKAFVDEIMSAVDPWTAADAYGMRASRNKRPGLNLVDDSTAFVGLASDDWLIYDGEVHQEPIEKSPFYTSIPYPENEYMPPYFDEPQLQFTVEESQQISLITTAVDTCRDEWQASFVNGSLSMDQWDDYMNALNDAAEAGGGMDVLLEIYNAAAQRYLDNQSASE
ncbi:MAG TPA: extracellular solute-binding protein [Candidatus Alectryocaccomicrobium excrementavium]|uniref:Extracellular solute-binding protein n=1 Tax=Candidatus Alectryocaccomicrobium excrementavium TaxID=2840668 RepID=A0A9D1G3T6_9FIRM|nr:extracellular solute-binding protein [Candidatus Alectryocaccomicrobium excrementavium]